MPEVKAQVVLPEDVVERILAMVPFPSVFKFRVLSKAWRARFSSISFQKQMSSRSSKWKTFCPVTLSPSREHLIAFDRTSDTWLRIPLPSFLHSVLVSESQVRHAYDLRMEGALLLLPTSNNELYVINILTQRWKQLPRCPHGTTLGRILFSHKSETYKVFVLPHETDVHNFLQIYDSATAVWSSMELAPSLRSSFYLYGYLDPVAYLDGDLYLVTIPSFHAWQYMAHGMGPCVKVLAINVKEENSAQEFRTVVELDLRGQEPACVHPVICKTNLLIAFVYSRSRGGHTQMMHVDLGTGELLRVAKCPPIFGSGQHVDLGTGESSRVKCPPLFRSWQEEKPVSDGDYVVARAEEVVRQLLTYDVHEDEWIRVPFSGLIDHAGKAKLRFFEEWIRSSFRPGLNPFAEV